MVEQEKVFIKNRKDQKVCVLVDRVENQKGLAFVMHSVWKSWESLGEWISLYRSYIVEYTRE